MQNSKSSGHSAYVWVANLFPPPSKPSEGDEWIMNEKLHQKQALLIEHTL